MTATWTLTRFKTIGDLMVTLATNGRDQRLKAVKSVGPGMNGYFDVGQGRSNQSPDRTARGLYRLLVVFWFGTDRQAGLLARVYNVGRVLQRVDMVGISPGSNGMDVFMPRTKQAA